MAMFPPLTEKERTMVAQFCDVFVEAINGVDDRRGLLLLKIAEELKRRDQNYSASLLERAAFEYGN